MGKVVKKKKTKLGCEKYFCRVKYWTPLEMLRYHWISDTISMCNYWNYACGGKCHNLNIGFAIKCEMQRPMRPRVCLGVKHTFTNGGKCKGWSPMTPKCIPILQVALVWELWMFRALVEKAKKHQIRTLGHH
jgi:hypothetical protein